MTPPVKSRSAYMSEWAFGVGPAEPAGPADCLLVLACGKTKLATAAPVPAGDLYVGPLFKARRRYAEADGRPWAILSALHGLIAPDTKIATYDRTIGELRGSELGAWLAIVRGDVVGRLAVAGAIVIEAHTGADYVAALQKAVLGLPVWITHAMPGQGIGSQLAAYKRKRKG